MNEITVIASEEHLPDVLQYFETKPKAEYLGLVGVTVRFSEKYLPEPNVIYSILSSVASKRVNIIEIVSTYTELTIVIEKNEMETAVKVLNQFFRKK